MAFKMGMSKEDLSGPPPVPNGVYDLQVVGFRPKLTKNGDGLNYNVEMTVYGNPELENKKVFHPLSTLFGVSIRDFSHACGLQLEKIADPEKPGEFLDVLPGTFENMAQYPDDPSKWGKYIGPLTNKILKAELATTVYQGKEKNEVRVFFCAVPNCATLEPDLKHSTNLIKAA